MTQSNNSNMALQGLKVIEMGQLIAGPFASKLLGEFGAEVIKIEPPGVGDPLRKWRKIKDGTSLWWHVQSRNKRSLTLDLKQAEAQDIVRRLVSEADVLVENFRPGTLEGWGLSYERSETRYEAQQTQVQVEGVVQTSDGREIAFALSLEMRREYLQTSSVSLRAGDALLKDPLVIHFDGPAGELSDLRLDFDLDADGNLDNMAFVGAGSGFLVLDKNGNGSVDDGRELFGALSGDGFADLAALDDDGNGWIDENDRAFDQLQVWQKDAEGQDRLRSLREANVGALYLGRVASPFSVRDANNQTLAEVRSTGVYLREDGGAIEAHLSEAPEFGKADREHLSALLHGHWQPPRLSGNRDRWHLPRNLDVWTSEDSF